MRLIKSNLKSWSFSKPNQTATVSWHQPFDDLRLACLSKELSSCDVLLGVFGQGPIQSAMRTCWLKQRQPLDDLGRHWAHPSQVAIIILWSAVWNLSVWQAACNTNSLSEEWCHTCVGEAKYFNHFERQHRTFSVFSIVLPLLRLAADLWVTVRRTPTVKHSCIRAACNLSKSH